MTMTETERAKWLAIQTSYQAALKIARASWPAETDESVIAAVAATLFIAADRQGNSAPARHVAPQPTTATPETNGAGTPPCPKCGSATAAVVKKSPKMPDYRCADRACDTPVWLRGAGK